MPELGNNYWNKTRTKTRWESASPRNEKEAEV